IGLLAGTLLGLVAGLLPVERLLSLDPENFTARSFIIEGIDRALGISIFTFFLLGLVATLEASGILEKLVERARRFSRSPRSAEVQIVAAAGVAVLLTTHSIVAILTVGEFARRTGERFGLHRYRRANLLDLTVVTFPFLLPYCIPVILAGSITASGAAHGIPPVSPLSVGLHNFYSWAILAVLIFSLVTGFGRRFFRDQKPD
ncbi:MAG: Na+/H+ antiporter NhaC family protein, partial [Acidobacteriota bacterium]